LFGGRPARVNGAGLASRSSEALQSRTRLGPYELVASVGDGGLPQKTDTHTAMTVQKWTDRKEATRMVAAMASWRGLGFERLDEDFVFANVR